MFKLLMFDVDGTLTEEGSDDISKALMDKLVELAAKDVEIVIASGRGYANLELVFSRLVSRAYFLADNGTKIYHEGKLIRSLGMPREKVEALLEDLKKLEGVSPVFAGPGKSLYLIRDWIEQGLMAFAEKGWDRLVTLVDSFEKVPQPITKISCFAADKQAAYAERLRPKWGETFEIVLSGGPWFDFMANGAGKGQALSFVQKQLALEPESCVAFGDQENDITAFETCGTSFAALGSALPIKQAAERVLIKPFGEGVLDVLEKMQGAGQLP